MDPGLLTRLHIEVHPFACYHTAIPRAKTNSAPGVRDEHHPPFFPPGGLPRLRCNPPCGALAGMKDFALFVLLPHDLRGANSWALHQMSPVLPLSHSPQVQLHAPESVKGLEVSQTCHQEARSGPVLTTAPRSLSSAVGVGGAQRKRNQSSNGSFCREGERHSDQTALVPIPLPLFWFAL